MGNNLINIKVAGPKRPMLVTEKQQKGKIFPRYYVLAEDYSYGNEVKIVKMRVPAKEYEKLYAGKSILANVAFVLNTMENSYKYCEAL